MSFLIRRSPDQSLFSDSPELIAASHVLHRLPAPRHPPYALSNLTIKFDQDKSLPLRDVWKRPWDEKDSFQLSKICFYSIPRPGGISSIQNWKMVELTRIELATSGVQNRRSPS